MSRPYKVIAVSVYLDDLERMDALVSALKAGGQPHVSRSALIRHAVAQMDETTTLQRPNTRRKPW